MESTSQWLNFAHQWCTYVFSWLMLLALTPHLQVDSCFYAASSFGPKPTLFVIAMGQKVCHLWPWCSVWPQVWCQIRGALAVTYTLHPKVCMPVVVASVIRVLVPRCLTTTPSAPNVFTRGSWPYLCVSSCRLLLCSVDLLLHPPRPAFPCTYVVCALAVCLSTVSFHPSIHYIQPTLLIKLVFCHRLYLPLLVFCFQHTEERDTQVVWQGDNAGPVCSDGVLPHTSQCLWERGGGVPLVSWVATQ